MKYLFNLLRFLSLLDYQGRSLSLSNLLIWVLSVKLALTGSPSLVDLGALFLSLLSYSHKRYTNHAAAKHSAETQEQLTDLNDKLTELNSRVNLVVVDVMKVENKQTESDKVIKEAKAVMINHKLSSGRV